MTTRREYAEQIAALVDEGLCTKEIGLRLGMTRQRVMRIAAQYGVRLQPRGGQRRVRAQLSAKDFAIIQRLADHAGVSIGTMLVRCARVITEQGTPAAARRLGRAALPKRPYTRKIA